jgi:hypothetical protein
MTAPPLTQPHTHPFTALHPAPPSPRYRPPPHLPHPDMASLSPPSPPAPPNSPSQASDPTTHPRQSWPGGACAGTASRWRPAASGRGTGQPWWRGRGRPGPRTPPQGTPAPQTGGHQGPGRHSQWPAGCKYVESTRWSGAGRGGAGRGAMGGMGVGVTHGVGMMRLDVGL